MGFRKKGEVRNHLRSRNEAGPKRFRNEVLGRGTNRKRPGAEAKDGRDMYVGIIHVTSIPEHFFAIAKRNNEISR